MIFLEKVSLTDVLQSRIVYIVLFILSLKASVSITTDHIGLETLQKMEDKRKPLENEKMVVFNEYVSFTKMIDIHFSVSSVTTYTINRTFVRLMRGFLLHEPESGLIISFTSMC